jgi:hypothetical protein
MQEAIVVYFMFMFMAVPEGNYFQNWKAPNPITIYFTQTEEIFIELRF